MELNDFIELREFLSETTKLYSTSHDCEMFKKAIAAVQFFMRDPFASPELTFKIDKLENSKIFHERQLIAIFLHCLDAYKSVQRVQSDTCK